MPEEIADNDAVMMATGARCGHRLESVGGRTGAGGTILVDDYCAPTPSIWAVGDDQPHPGAQLLGSCQAAARQLPLTL
jgi:pyruvate/2-oxoglutarate dehydrogenase complex dihydrolipoamide dehydrogenase (E3) component